MISCSAKLFTPDATEKIGSGVMLALPKEASAKLPSRGMTMVKGTINGADFQAVLEPDGQDSHWFKVSEALQKAAKAGVGDTVELEITPSKDWPEPKVPADLKRAVEAEPKVLAVWNDITPMARWDWIRWVGATKNPETRARRIEVACSKMRSGMRRACCFDRAQCTLTDA